MSCGDAFGALAKAGVIPVVTLPTPADAVPVARALLAGGLPIVEVTFRSEGAPEAITRIRTEVPEMCVGAGTVTGIPQLRSAVSAGAQFALSPGLSPELTEEARGIGLAFFPGVCTPSEIQRALELGLKVLKFFPAGALGGPETIKAMLAPFLHLGVQLIPTGGVTDENAAEYWALPGVIAVGGTWIAPPPLVEAKRWHEVEQRARAAVVRRAAIEGQTP